MIRVGGTILNENFIAAIRPANDDGIIVPAEVATLTVVSLSSGEKIAIEAPMSEACGALERVGYLEPDTAFRPDGFTPGELDELKTKYEEGFRFAARDDDGKAYVFSAMPTKGKASWINDDDVSTVNRLYNDYLALSFSDAQPLEIGALLNQMGVEA